MLSWQKWTWIIFQDGHKCPTNTIYIVSWVLHMLNQYIRSRFGTDNCKHNVCFQPVLFASNYKMCPYTQI